jgi:hypothetical protein
MKDVKKLKAAGLNIRANLREQPRSALIGGQGRLFFTHIDTHGVLPLPDQTYNVDVRIAL